MVLATGIVPNEGIGQIQQLLKLSKAADGLLMEAHPKLKPVDTTIDGVFLRAALQDQKIFLMLFPRAVHVQDAQLSCSRTRKQ